MRYLLIVALLSGCSIGPRRLQKDCNWISRPETKAENVVGFTSIGLTLGGLATFLGAFAAKRGDIAGPAFAATGVGILGTWWALGAFEEVPLPGSRIHNCRHKHEAALRGEE